MPAPEEAIEQIAAAGGVSVLAHPKQLKLGGKGGYRPTLRRMKEAGLDGLEVHHPTHDKNWRKQFTGLADELDLVVSGGSDFHGSAANPAASATLSDPAFVTGRFATLQSRRPATAEEHTEESADA